MERISGQKGSNRGGFYRDGSKVVYVKFYANKNQAYCEALANQIYNAVGIPASQSVVKYVDSELALVSDKVDGVMLRDTFSENRAKAICKGFIVDAFLANYDVIGLEQDNILVDFNTVYRIDNGSAFMYRACGGRKNESSLYRLDELDSFFVRGQYPAIFKAAGVKSLNDLDWKPVAKKLVAYVKSLRISSRFPAWAGAGEVNAMLAARMQILEELV